MNKAFAFLKSLDWKIWLAIIIVVVLIIILIVINNRNKQPIVTTSTTVVNQPSSGTGNDSFPLKYGSRGPNVGKWQTYLNSKGASLNVDNIWGPLTDAASLKYTGFNSIAAEYFNSVIK